MTGAFNELIIIATMCIHLPVFPCFINNLHGRHELAPIILAVQSNANVNHRGVILLPMHSDLASYPGSQLRGYEANSDATVQCIIYLLNNKLLRRVRGRAQPMCCLIECSTPPASQVSIELSPITMQASLLSEKQPKPLVSNPFCSGTFYLTQVQFLSLLCFPSIDVAIHY